MGQPTIVQRLCQKSLSTQWLANLVLFICSILFAIGGVETLLRLSSYGEQFRSKHFTPTSTLYPRFYHSSDSISGFDISPEFPARVFNHREYMEAFGTPFTISSNELGCRDKSMDRREPYVLLLGDSFAWAFVPLENAFGTVLEELIGVRVLKCGVSGYGTRQQRHKLEQIVKQVGPPSVIVVAYFVGNDLEDDYLYPEYTVLDGYLVRKVTIRDSITGERQVYTDNELREQIKAHISKDAPTFKNFMATHFRVYNLLQRATGLRRLASMLGLADKHSSMATVGKERIEEVFYRQEDEWLRDAWTLHLDNLRQLKKAADEQNAPLFVVLIPTPAQVYDHLRPADEGLDWEHPNRRLREFFEKEEISALDLLPEFKRYVNQPKPKLNPQEDLYWHYDGHLNLKGNRLAGLLISQSMLEQTILELRDTNQRLSNVKQLLSHW